MKSRKDRPATLTGRTDPRTAKQIQAAIRKLGQSGADFSWQGADRIAAAVLAVLDDIRRSITDPQAGLQLVTEIFEADDAILNACDDSNGAVGSVFRGEVTELFAHFAARCDDKDALANLVIRLHAGNEYGVRDELIHFASQFLPPEILRSMVLKCQMRSNEKPRREHDFTWSIAIESLARQLKDPELFEATRRASWGKMNAAAYVDVAAVYSENGRHEEALALLHTISLDDKFHADERDDLLVTVCSHLDRKAEAEQAALRMLRRARTADRLDRLLAIAGTDRREAVLAEEVRLIFAAEDFSPEDALFLAGCGKLDDAQRLTLDHAHDINGDAYYSLLPLAELFEDDLRFVPASVVYRALIDSILARAISKYYHYGVRYLKKLDRLARRVDDWMGMETHEQYTAGLHVNHRLKRSFWERVEGKTTNR